MAKPRIFVSSTFYDLKHVRSDLESFIIALGYDTIMNDKGQIPYSATQPLQENCYDEAGRADILVGIIGGRYGSDSDEDFYSVSMKEIKAAIKNNKQVFIFVEKSVLSEHQTYQLNKESSEIKFAHVDDIKIHKFIEEIHVLKINNAMIPFESASDITNFLKEQFAGLFQRLLQDRATLTEQTTLYDLNQAIQELKSVSSDIKEENVMFVSKFNGSIFAVNPVVNKIAKFVGLKKGTLFIEDKDSLYEFLNVLGYSISDFNDDDYDPFKSADSFWKNTDGMHYELIIKHDIFDSESKIKDIRKSEQLEQLISYSESAISNTDFNDLYDGDSDLPF